MIRSKTSISRWNLLSKDDYDALTETAYLLRNPAGAERLLAALERARRGEHVQHELIEE